MFYETSDRDKDKLCRTIPSRRSSRRVRSAGYRREPSTDGSILRPTASSMDFAAPRRSSASPARDGRTRRPSQKRAASSSPIWRRFDLRDPMNATSAPLARGDNEFVHAGLTMAECRLVAAPRVAESPASLECKVVEILEIRSRDGSWSGSVLTIGEVVGVPYRRGLCPRGPFRHSPARIRWRAAAIRITPSSNPSFRWRGRKAAATSEPPGLRTRDAIPLRAARWSRAAARPVRSGRTRRSWSSPRP